MALTISTFVRVSNGPVQVFYYKTADAIAAVDADDYFFTTGVADANGEGTRGMVNEHDVIWVVDTTNDLVGALMVTAATASTVTTVIANAGST
jgi:hypothetical protein